MASIYYHIVATVLKANGSIDHQPLCTSNTQVRV